MLLGGLGRERWLLSHKEVDKEEIPRVQELDSIPAFVWLVRMGTLAPLMGLMLTK